MEKMHVASSANHAASGTTAAKHRASQGAPSQEASAGDFLGLLAALGDNLLSSNGTPGEALLPQSDQKPQTLATPNGEAAPGALMSSLLALQAGFAGNNPAALPDTSAPQTPSDQSAIALPRKTGLLATVQPQPTQKTSLLSATASAPQTAGLAITPHQVLPLVSTQPQPIEKTSSPLISATASAPQAAGLAITPHQVLPLVSTQPQPTQKTSPLSTTASAPQAAELATRQMEGNLPMPAGARSVAIASSGGELGLVAQTAALDTASESAQTFGLGKKILGRNFAAASSVSTTEAWAARTASNQRLDAPHMTNVATTVVQAAVNNAQPQQQPHDWLPAGGGGLPTTSNEAMNAPGSDVLGGLLAGQGQGAGRGNDGGRGASAGQNPDAQGLYGLSGPSTDSATLAENPMFDLASALPTEDSVAEQVSYWVNQNIQNAELTIEHDGHPVQVTVSLNGNEAHVSFTSDQNETRALLDASVAQLRALLESQGLVLSGMSVGESATQGQNNNANGQRNNAPTDARKTTVEANALAQRPRSADIISDKAVDIFV